jgi:hypothetical protein
MSYTVQSLKTKADCQELINNAAIGEGNLAFKKTSLERKQDSSALNAIDIDTDLIGVTAELSALEAAYAGMPAGKAKDEMQSRITTVAYRKFTREKRRKQNGALVLLQKEYETRCVDLAIAENEAYVLAVTNRMAELP